MSMTSDNPSTQSSERTVYKALSLVGLTVGGAVCAVDVKNDKIVRVRPMHFDSKYSIAEMGTWKMERNGKTIEGPVKSLPSPFSLAYSRRAFSPNRIKYPLKRELVAGELRRVVDTYGPYAVLAQADGHAECKLVHSPHGCQTLLLQTLGGYTQQIRNSDSWEGWYWGAEHVWGRGDVGMMSPFANVANDITRYSDLVLFWGCDPETTPWGFTGQFASKLCYFWAEAGIRQIYVCPELNYGAAVHADKWIPIFPNTDAALQLAIIYVWLTEGTWNKEYVATHVVGMDKVGDYVMGREDGVPKTPEWASAKCGVPEWTIKALARDFAENTTSIAHYFGGGMIRGPYSSEPGRLEPILLGMQGLGSPGVHQWQITWGGMPRSVMTWESRFPGNKWSDPAARDDRIIRPHANTAQAMTKQMIPKTLIQEAILNPPITFWGTGAHYEPPENQFTEYTYPLPKEEGGSEIHMIWTDTPCRTTCWNDGNKTIEAMRNPKIECIVAQHPWLENDCLLADIILPSNTTFEIEDITFNVHPGRELRAIVLMNQAIKPIGESKSDYEVVLEIAKKLGKYEEVTRGKTSKEWIKYSFDQAHLENFISWEQFEEKGYFVEPVDPNWEDAPAGLREFYEDPEGHPLRTPSGKLEFYSERLATHFPDDAERGPYPKWIEKGITHDERLSSDRARKYPLLLMSNHGRWRVHSQADDITWTREAPTCKIKGPDGYMYEPLWINPSTAAERGIENGDIVKAHNERGAVLCGAYVTQRIMPGVAYVDHGSRCDWIIPGKLDRGGAINLISPAGITSKHSGGQATSGYLVEVEKVTLAQMEQWKAQYPQAFERVYDPAAGLRSDGWVVAAT